ncbi:unnamed protein product [Chrysoparadoxa australica]
MKTRFTQPDVVAMVRDLRSSVLGLRVVNVYDVDQKTYLLKLANPGEEKVMLLLESGVRFHTTRYSRDKPDMPSAFSMKLRKHIRSKRLESVRQLGTDRVVDFRFGSGESTCHILLELYASGNIILTDGKYEVLQLLRVHSYDDKTLVAVHQVGPAKPMNDLPLSSLRQQASPSPSSATLLSMYPAAHAVADSEGEVNLEAEDAAVKMLEWLTSTGEGSLAPLCYLFSPLPVPPQNTSKRAKKASLKQLLMRRGSGVSVYGPSIIEHCILSAGLKPNLKLQDVEALVSGLREAGGVTDRCSCMNAKLMVRSHSTDFMPCLKTYAYANANDFLVATCRLQKPGQEGYIMCKKPKHSSSGVAAAESKSSGAERNEDKEANGEVTTSVFTSPHSLPCFLTTLQQADSAPELLYDEFLPHLLQQHKQAAAQEDQEDGTVVKAFESFDRAVDEFYCKIEDQRLWKTATAAKAAATAKVENIARGLQERQAQLEADQEHIQAGAEAVEARAKEVEQALMVIRSALANGIDWVGLEDLVEQEQSNGNPIALLIDSLKLDEGRVVLSLDDVLVEVDVEMTAHANANAMYAALKSARSKARKTMEAAAPALKQAEEKAAKALKTQTLRTQLSSSRKVYWFEKFYWFITSENYMVLSGKDAQQNETLVKKYLRECDAYVHADMHGASTVIVRNKDPTGARPISVLALQEAGTLAACRSSAWKSKVISSAWWVMASQVSKAAPTGEYLSTGSFMIRGKKNFLPPRPLEMGFALLFAVDETCVAAHAGERREREEELPYPSDGTGLEDRIEPGNGGDVVLHDNLASHYPTSSFELFKTLVCLGVAQNGAGTGASLTGRAGKKRVSIKERRRLKKDLNANDPALGADPALGGDPESCSPPPPPADSYHKPEQEETSKMKPQAASQGSEGRRGKSGKLKKMKKKYRDQDEEEREISLQMLGVVKRQEPEEEAGSDQGAAELGSALLHEANDQALAELDTGVLEKLQLLEEKGLLKVQDLDAIDLKALAKFSREDALSILGHFDKADPRKIRNRSRFLAQSMQSHSQGSTSQAPAASTLAAADGADANAATTQEEPEGPAAAEEDDEGEKQLSRRERKLKEEEEVKNLLEEEGQDLDPTVENASELDRLTGKPLPSDILHHALAVCAPYNSLQGYKYRVKLTPGSQKKGKACKQCIEVFSRNKEATKREVDLMRALTDPEMVAVMLGEVIISVPGLQAAKKSSKAKRSKGKKR